MEKNKNNAEKETEKRNYTLKSEAVDELVKADAENTPKYSEEELNKYRAKSKIHIPEPVKVLFIKAWFAGAVCFFILWGLGTYITAMLDMLFILGIVLGMVTDLLVNNTIRFIEKSPGANDSWLMFPQKGMGGFCLNLLYGCLLIVCVFMTYNGINGVITTITGDVESVPLGVEPILFGVFTMAFDMLFIGIKRLVKSIISDAMVAAKSGKA